MDLITEQVIREWLAERNSHGFFPSNLQPTDTFKKNAENNFYPIHEKVVEEHMSKY